MKRKLTSLIALLLVAVMLTLTACDNGNTPADTTTGNDDPTTNTTLPDDPSETTAGSSSSDIITVIANGKSTYSVIRPDKCSDEVKNAATNFKNQLAAAYGNVKLTYETDWVKTPDQATNDKFEILVGNTNRPETAEAIKSLSGDMFTVRVIKNKIVICGASDEATVRALDFFIASYAVGDSLTLNGDLNIINQNPPTFLSSSPENLYTYIDGKSPEIIASFTSNSAIDLAKSSIAIDGTDMTAKATWTQSKVTLSAPDLDIGKHVATIAVFNKEGGINILRKEFSVATSEKLNVYTGEVHSHTTVSDGKGAPADAFKYARDTGKVDFFAVTDHSYTKSKAGFTGKTIVSAEEFNNPGKFVAIYGYEVTYFATNGYYGHYNVLNDKTYLGSGLDASTKEKLSSVLAKVSNLEGAIGQFNHPGYDWGTFNDFNDYTEAADKATSLIEIWGSTYEQYLALALAKGWHISPVFNEDTHDATWTTKNEAVTCVLAPTLTRANILEAMAANRTYMTEDKTLKLFYKINGQWMGSILNNPDKLNVTVELSTSSPTGLGKINLVAEDMITVASIDLGTKTKYTWELTLDPEYSYYYVTMNSPKYAVSAPIWIENNKSITITDLTQSLITGTADKKDHVVTASLKNTGSKAITDVTVTFYQTANETGFDPSKVTPVSTVKLGTVNAGQTIDASAAFEYTSENARRVTAIVSGKIDGVPYIDTAFTVLHQLYITEIMPAPSKYNGVTDPFAFIEIYNNTDSDMNLTGYTLRYWTNTDAITNGSVYCCPLSGTIKAHDTLVIWMKSIYNSLNASHISTYYGKTFTEGDNLLIIQSGKGELYPLNKDQSMQIDIVKGTNTICRAWYNWGENLGTIVTDKSMTYDYPHLYTVTAALNTNKSAPSPDSLTGSSVPKLITESDWSELKK